MEALFGPTVRDVVGKCKIGFDTHFGSVNIVYFDEHGTPLESSADRSPDFLHAMEEWFKYYSKRNRSSTIKIEKANGSGFVIAVVPIVHHKTKDSWFKLYMDKEQWKNSEGQYWKDGKRYVPLDGNKVLITFDAGSVVEKSIMINAPKDELQVNVMLELLR